MRQEPFSNPVKRRRLTPGAAPLISRLRVGAQSVLAFAAMGTLIAGCSGDPEETPTTPPSTPVETPTQAPVTPTQAPATPTHAPATPTEEPATPTQEPATPTQAPATPTQAPATPTATQVPDTPTPPPVHVLNRASKSSTIALSSDDGLIAMVNPEDDTVSVFSADTYERLSRVSTGDEPSAVVIHPDNTRAYVANRAEATVVELTDLDTVAPGVGTPVDVGSEPTGLALSPTGAQLFVAEWAEGRVTVIDTATMEVISSIDTPGNPRSILITNDGDEEDDDELLVVPEFYGTPVAGKEAQDDGRLGKVDVYQLTDYSQVGTITLNPRDSGFVPDGTSNGTVFTSPNQLYSVATREGRVYVTSVSASPKGPAKFNGNVQPVVYVADLDTLTEVTDGSGTTNLAKEVADAIPTGTRYFLADIVDMDFKEGTNFAYVLSRGAEVLQRVVYNETDVTIGSSFNTQIDIGTAPAGQSEACKVPTGVVTSVSGAFAFVNCWNNRRLGVVDLSIQALVNTVEAAPAPTGDDAIVNRGRKFYFTARGRWSKEGWSGCGSCHPDGLSDNMTWIFAAGPRQTTSMDGSFSKGSSTRKQRIFNWSGIFDEMHDFEANTRGVSGGLGAITTSSTGQCGTLSAEQQVTLPANLAQPVKEVQDTTTGVCTKDWDDILAFTKTIRPPSGLKSLDAASVARGRTLFGEPTTGANNAGCVRCHGGAGWTASRLFWVPSSSQNTALFTDAFSRPSTWPSTWNYNTFETQTQPIISETTTGPAEAAAITPNQVSCVLRNISTFGVPGDTTSTDALEKKPDGSRAQGRGGYNVPALYGLSVGAPYLHHGQAMSLTELINDSKWSSHLSAGNAVLSLNAQQKQDLINFLLSIDASTAEFQLPTTFDGCVTIP